MSALGAWFALLRPRGGGVRLLDAGAPSTALIAVRDGLQEYTMYCAVINLVRRAEPSPHTHRAIFSEFGRGFGGPTRVSVPGDTKTIQRHKSCLLVIRVSLLVDHGAAQDESIEIG